MNKISILAVMILLMLPLFAVFLPWAAASARSQLSPFPKARDEKSVSDFVGDEAQPGTDGFEEKFPKELKPLRQGTPVDQEEQAQTWLDTEHPSKETTAILPDQSDVIREPLENKSALPSENAEPLGSTSIVFSETFEGTFPGDNWWVGDANPSSGSDYWDDTSYRAAIGSWSGWCAQVGDNSVYGGTNVAQHKYDAYMDAYISKKYVVDMSAWDIGYVDFYAWYDTESSYDYLIGGWYDGSSFIFDNNFKLTGTATSWPRYYWRIPEAYLISSGAFSFSFHSDGSIVREGVYLDNINLVRADVTLDNYYISPTSVHPGESFTAYYYVSNPCPFSTTVGLGLSIRSPGGTTYNDLAHDTQVTIGSGAFWVSRQFTVPSSAPPGLYEVMWGIHSKTPGTGGREWGYSGWQRVLTVAGWPDLMWTDIWTDPSSPTGGQNARIYCQIKNQGDSTSTSFTNYFYIDGTYDSYGVNSGLGGGSLYNWYMDRTLGPGYHTILARADVNNNVQESNEANNDYSEKIWWKGPDLIVVDIWWIDAYGNRNPVITSGQPFTVYFQIKNNGDASAVGTFTSYLFVDGWGSAAGSNSGLAAGATYTWYATNVYVSSTGSHPVRAVVDYNGAIAEANKDTGSGIGTGETNNERTTSLSVARASWTLLAYLDGDNNLEGYQINDILSMAEVGSTVSVSVMVELDRNPGYDTRYNNWADCRVFFVTWGLQPYDTNALLSLGEVNMGASATLSSFATWGMSRCLADKYLLVIEDHGGSWVGCCWDDTSGSDRLDSSEIKSSLSTISSTLGRKIDLVWFNDCLMGSIEIAAQVHQYCSYMAASETIGWTDTWAYNSLLNSLVTNPSVSPQQYCIQITNLANAHDDPTHVTQSVCSIDLSKASNLVAASNSLSQSLKSNLYQYRTQIQAARASSSWMEGPYAGQDQRIIDLYQIAQNIRNAVPDSTIQAQAQEILNQIGPAGGSIGYIVMRERHSASASFCHGLSIYFPLDSARYNNPPGYTTGVDFTSNTQWDEFLTCYYDVTPPNNPNSYTSSHSLGVWSSDNTIEVTWSGASDDLSGVYGYSRIWDTSSSTIPDTTVDQTGTFCISFPVLTGNSWHLHVRTVDNAGNWNPNAYHVGPFYVDTSSPNTPSLSESHCGTGWTSHNSPYFEWNNPGDEGSGVSSYEGSIDDGTPFSASTPYHPTWSDGIHSFKVRTVDAVGLRSGWSNIITVMIDTTAPNNPNSYSSNPPVNVWSNDNTVDIDWSGASDSLSEVHGYSFEWDQSPTTLPDTTEDTMGTSTTSPALADGSNWHFHVRTSDNAGNWANDAYHVGPFKIDTTQPSTPSPDDGVSGPSSDNTPTFTWAPCSDSHSGVKGYWWKVDDEPETWTTETSVTLPVQPDGSDTFYVRAEDNAGNKGNYGQHDFQILTALHFDFGTSSSPVEPGYIQVTETTAYSEPPGYGWSAVSGSYSRDRGLPDNLRRDLVQSTTDHTFLVFLPNGEYGVTLLIGDDSYTHDLIDVYAEGTLKINDLTVTKGSFQEWSFTIAVIDGQLNLLFHDDGGTDGNWIINAITIGPPPPSFNVHLESVEDTEATSNEGSIIFDGVPYGLPDDVSKPAGTYMVSYAADVYVLDHWETSDGVSISDSIVTVTADGTLRAVYKTRPTKFDFGTSSSPVETDYVKVDQASLYSSSIGYGWSTVSGLYSRDRSLPDNLRRDLVQSTGDHVFNVDLPNGDYQVTLVIGDYSYRHDLIDVYAESVLKVDDLAVPKGSFQMWSFTMAVTDGQLNIVFHDDGGTDGNWIINAITIGPPPPSYNIHLESEEDSAATLNMGSIIFDGVPYDLPIDISKPAGTYVVSYMASEYVLDHWETSDGVSISGSIVTVTGDGTLRAVYKTRPTKFDFGTSSSPVEPGYVQVTEATAYSGSLGYGWSSTSSLSSRDRGTPDNLRRDLVQSTSDHTFLVDLPNGEYSITLLIGDHSYTHDLIDISAEGTLKINDLTVPKGSSEALLLTVTVIDGQLNLNFRDDGGTDGNWVINAITIGPVL